MAVPRPYPTNMNTLKKPGPSWDERRTETPQNTPCPAHEPRRLSNGRPRDDSPRCHHTIRGDAGLRGRSRCARGRDRISGCWRSPHAAGRRGLGSEQRPERTRVRRFRTGPQGGRVSPQLVLHLLLAVPAPVPHTHHFSVSRVSLTPAYDSSRP